MNNLKRRVLFLLSLATLLSFETKAQAQTPSRSGQLTVTVNGLKSTVGKLVVDIFREQDDLFGKPYRQQTVPISDSAVTVLFSSLPDASYVVFAFHDLNSNGILDHNWLHIPAEPMGYSNDWHFGLLTGMPTFEKTKFSFPSGRTAVTISLK